MIWAAVDVLDGRCVQLRGGEPHTARFAQDPVAAAQRWAKEGADGLHLIDLNAALETGDNRSILEQIIRSVDLPVQIGGGVRETQSVERWLEAGARRVIVGTRGVRDPAWLKEMTARFPKKIILAIDARGDEVTVEGWTRGSGQKLLGLACAVDDFELAAFLYTNVDVEGSLQGMKPGPVKRLCTSVQTPVLVSGGLRDAEDVRLAYRCGAAGVVLGTSLYTGTIRWADLARVRREEKQHGEK